MGTIGSRHLDAAIQGEVGEVRDESVRSWLDTILVHALTEQPELVAELSRSAARGDVHHEARVLVTLEAEGKQITGSIDLLFQDDAGAWRLLDYKTDAPEGSLAEFQRKYYSQVTLYHQALERLTPPVSVSRIGLWRLKSGHVLEWD